MRLLAWSVVLCVFFLVGALVGVFSERLRTPPSTHEAVGTSRVFAAAGVESARSDPDRTWFLLKNAIANMGHAPDDCAYVWNALHQIAEQGASDIRLEELQTGFLHALEIALLAARNIDDFERLMRLRALVETTTAASPDEGASSTNGRPPGEERISPAPETSEMRETEAEKLLREGLQASMNRDTDRAEFLTQAALRCQDDAPQVAAGLWEQYREYLEDLANQKKLLPYDRVARLSAYAEGIEQALLASRSVKDFETVWSVRKEVLNQMGQARADLAREAADKIAQLRQDMREKASQGEEPNAITMLGTGSEKLRLKALVVMGTSSANRAETKELRDSIRTLLEETIRIGEAQWKSLKEKLNDQASIDSKGQSVNPERPGTDEQGTAKGTCEKLAQEVSGLLTAFDEADLESWLHLIEQGEEGAQSQTENSEYAGSEVVDSLRKKLSDVLEKLADLEAGVRRLQGLRYNLWALQSIYRAELSPNWDDVLGNIDVGFLNPTVAALYSAAYQSLITGETEPRIRIGRVQTILNKPKITFAAF